jgi:hypothetical protein
MSAIELVFLVIFAIVSGIGMYHYWKHGSLRNSEPK